MSQLTVEIVMEQIDAVHRELARMTVDQLMGTPSALNTLDILQSRPAPLRPKTLEFLRKSMKSAGSTEEAERIERIMFACMDLVVEEETASLGDMLRFYMERGRMHVGGEKIPALEVVPWLQAQADFDKREAMQKENSIFLKGIINPMLLGMLELTVRTVTQRFGYDNYVRYAEAKKQVDFDETAGIMRRYLDTTKDAYLAGIVPWVEEIIGRPFSHLSRYHALYLVRIRRFDEYFSVSDLRELIHRTFQGLGFVLSARTDVTTDLTVSSTKNPNGICIGVEVPGQVHVLVNPVGGLIDAETLLHEMGHAYFISHFNPNLPVEYRRLYRSPALDETYAFFFQDLVENEYWLTKIAGMPSDKAKELAGLFRTKKLCLIRRHIGKFLAEKELHESGEIKNPEPYCRHLEDATGFVYEPVGYLIDMEPDFYALDYLMAWGGAHVLRQFIEMRFGMGWFEKPEAGEFLKEMASAGRRDPLEKALVSFCGEKPRLPEFTDTEGRR
ncbi:MAG: hypothetical protein RDU20_07600 [Desulfomonilaceae bacterium]|nr:hypothetical protein [Desulfomonilaceae bacterium]